MNLKALSQAIKTLADAVKDTMAAIQPGQSILGRLASYSNLIPDLEALIPQIGDIVGEASALKPEDYVTLVSLLVTDLAVTDEKAKAIIAASLKLLSDLALVIVPDAQSLIAAINTPAAPAPSVAPAS